MNPLRLALASLSFAGAVLACSSTTVTATGTGDDAGAPGEGDASTPEPEDAAVAPEAAAPFKLTSTALVEGATFKTDNTCNGANKSPDLAWGPGPEGTKSYAIVFNDESLDFLHGVTYDIPVTTTSLPAGVENTYEPAKVPGAKQTLSYLTNRYGYAGPCAPKPNEDTYELVLYALNVETLPNMTKTTTRGDAETEVKKHVLKSTRLTGKYKQP
jgi:Raf kinase inhibitor-like YbhB/YbcL family protein